MSEDREELRCCIFIIALIIILALSAVIIPYIVSFLAIAFYFWYIFIPAFIGLGFLINYLIKKKHIHDAYMTLNTPPYQNKFEHETGKKALEDNKITDEFRDWLIEKVKPTKTRRRIRIPFRDIKGFLYVIVFIIVLTAIYLWIYSLIFPEWLIPFFESWFWQGEGRIPGYDALLVIGIIFIFGSIFIFKSIKRIKIK